MSTLYKMYNTFRTDNIPLVIQAMKMMISNFLLSSMKYSPA